MPGDSYGLPPLDCSEEFGKASLGFCCLNLSHYLPNSLFRLANTSIALRLPTTLGANVETELVVA